MKINKTLLGLIFFLVFSVSIEMYFQETKNIIGLGIISMIYGSVALIHDILLKYNLPYKSNQLTGEKA